MVRVYDEKTGKYFKSEVYAKINRGWFERYLVRVPCPNGDYMQFYDCLDKEKKASTPRVLINTIVPDQLEKWIYQESVSGHTTLPAYSHILLEDTMFFSYNGPEWLYKTEQTLASLIRGETVLVRESVFQDKIIHTKKDGWHYIEMQADIDDLMKKTCRFHDSVIKTVNYVSGSYVNKDKSMFPVDAKRCAVIIVESQITDTIEMVFEGVTALNVRPAGDNYTSNIFEASVFIEDCVVFFCDSKVSGFATDYVGTWITAYSMRWRFI